MTTTTARDAIINMPEVLSEELLWMIRTGMAMHPRSLQKAIGASSLGNPCSIALIHDLLGDAPSGGGSRTGWLAQIGTCVHAWLERILPLINDGQFQKRFLVEQEVMVGEVGGIPIMGHLDLFDIDTSTVVDWKVVSAKRREMFRNQGPGETYRRQAHLYGYGLSRMGHHVRYVMIYFLPRERELDTAYAWAEPYDETVALETISRANGLLDLVNSWGIEQVVNLYQPCGQRYCRWCPQPIFPS